MNTPPARESHGDDWWECLPEKVYSDCGHPGRVPLPVVTWLCPVTGKDVRTSKRTVFRTFCRKEAA